MKYNLSEAGRRLNNRSRTTVRRLVDSGLIVAEKDPGNGNLVIDETEIARFMAAYSVYVPPHKPELSQHSHTPSG